MKLTADEIWIGFSKSRYEAECKICKIKLKRVGGQTSSLHYHLVNKHKKDAEYIKQFGSLRQQPSLDNYCSVRAELTKRKKDLINDALIKLITKSSLSLRLIGTTEFREFVNSLNASYVLPSAAEFTHLIDDKVASNEENLKLMLKDKKVGITADEWSLLKKDVSILAIRVFWVQKNKKVSYTARCVPMEQHDAEAYTKLLRECMSKYDIKPSNVVSFTTDAGSALKKAVKTFIESSVSEESCVWIHCIPHRLHLTITNGLRFSSLYQELMDILGKLSSDVHHSWRNQDLFKKFASNFGEPATIPPKFIATRWNSLACTVRHVIAHKNSVVAYQVKRSLPVMTKNIFEFTAAMTKVFDSFEMCSKYCCRNTALLSEALAALQVLRNTLKSHTEKKFQIEMMELLEKFDHYFGADLTNTDILKYLLLDPRFSFDSKLLSLTTWTTLTKKFPIRENIREDANHSHPLGNLGGEEKGSEVQRYSDFLISCRPHKLCDVFLWWTDKKSTFPALYTYFWNMCVTSPSSCDVERLFSTATWLYSQKKRNRLLSSTASKLLFLSSNFATDTPAPDDTDACEEQVKEEMMEMLYKEGDESSSTLTQAMDIMDIEH